MTSRIVVRAEIEGLRSLNTTISIVLEEHDRLRKGINEIMELCDREAVDVENVAGRLANLLWEEEA
jgi:hypothetical protein